jgi:hypothetical protein
MKTVRPEIPGRATTAAAVTSVDPEELIAAVVAAQLLHVRPATLTCWRNERRGPRFLKVGRFVFYRRADLAAWLATQLHEPQAA